MKEDGKTLQEKKSRKKIRSDGKIAGQGMKKDSVTTLLFQANNENFAELFNRTLLAGQPVSPEELDEENIKETAYVRITKEGGGTTLVQYRDVVKGVRNERIFAVLGIEHQSEIDYAMPYRVLELDFVNYARQMQIIRERHDAEWKAEKGKRRRPPGITDGEYLGRFLRTDRIVRCVTLVVYWGEEPWDGPVRLSDLFETEAEAPCAVQVEMNLLDVCRMSDEEICSYTGELRTVFGFRKHAENKERLGAFIAGNREHFSSVSETAMNALEELTHSPELKKIRTPEYQTTEGGYNVCRGIQGMIQDGKLEGIKEGIQEGIKEGIRKGIREGILEGEAKAKKEMSRSLADMGMSVEKIAEAAKVSIPLVREWLSENAGCL